MPRPLSDHPSSDRAPSRTAVATLDHVVKRFAGTAVVDRLSLAVAPGEVVTLLGPSGCGKSTALRLVAGLETADSGLVDAPEKSIGYVFQDATLMPWASALDNVALPLRLSRLPKIEARARAATALARVGLTDAADKPPRQLSGGMRMRVALARALVGDPRLLLMDEPFAALDEITRFRLGEDLVRLAAARRVAVLFVTHSVYEAAALSDRVLIMAGPPGRIVDEVAIATPVRGADFRATPAFAEIAADLSRRLAAAAALSRPIDAGPPTR